MIVEICTPLLLWRDREARAAAKLKRFRVCFRPETGIGGKLESREGTMLLSSELSGLVGLEWKSASWAGSAYVPPGDITAMQLP